LPTPPSSERPAQVPTPQGRGYGSLRCTTPPLILSLMDVSAAADASWAGTAHHFGAETVHLIYD
jgi:hypothetical protein